MFNPLSKSAWAKHFIEVYGKEVMENPELAPGFIKKTLDFLNRNKTTVGAVAVTLSQWAFSNGCPDVFGIDLTQGWFTCEHWKDIFTNAGCLLVGAGILDADALTKRKQQIASGNIPNDRKP